MINIEAKVGNASWHRLSVGLHDNFPLEAMERASMDYLHQYAMDRQCNPDTVSIRAIRHGAVYYTRPSNAIQNAPIKDDHFV